MKGVARLGIAVLAALVVLPRLYLGVAGQPIHWNDSWNYLEAARSLIASGVVEDRAFRTPGYPVFLAACSVFGDMEQVAVLVQQLLGIVIAGLVFDLGRRVFRRASVAWAALALYALDMRFVICAQTILTELLQMFVVVALVWALVVWRERRSVAWLVVAGGLIGVAPLVRPVALLYAPFAAAYVAYVVVRGGGRSAHAFAPVLLIAALAVAPPAAWTVRNAARYGCWKLTPMHHPHLLERVVHLVDLEAGGEPEVRRLFAGIVGKENSRLGAGLRLFHALRERGVELNEADAACGRLFRETVAARFATYVGELPVLLVANLRLSQGHPDIRARWPAREGDVVLQGWPKWGPAVFTDASSVLPWVYRSFEKVRNVPLATTLVHVFTHTWLALTILALSFIGVYRSVRSGDGLDASVVLMIATIVYYCVLPTFTVPSCDRFRQPVEPLMIVLAARALSPRGDRSPDS